MPRSIDMTPSWSEVLPSLILLLERGTDEGKAFAKEELKAMAILASLLVAENKNGIGEWANPRQPSPQLMLHEARSIRRG